MKLKSLVFLFCFSWLTLLFAANQHVHPQTNLSEGQSVNKGVKWPGYCEIEIVNHSFDDVRVFGVFDDGTSFDPFIVYSFESPHYISLYYDGYCHSGMDLYIDTLKRGYLVYSGYTPRKTTIRIVPAISNQVQAEVKTK